MDMGDSFDDDDGDFQNDEEFAEAGDDDEPFGRASSGPIESKMDFQVLNTELLTREMEKVVGDFASVVGLPHDIAALLLRVHRWNKEELVNRYIENTNSVLDKSGLKGFENIGRIKPNEKVITCKICDEEIAQEDTFALQCGHFFCKQCWSDYLDDKIKQGTVCVKTTCPMYKCSLLVPDGAVLNLVTDDMKKKYLNSVLRAFVEDNRRLRWCPAPGCEHAILSYGHTNVRCACGYRFCFQCNEESHAPITCDQLQTWLDKCKNESETAHWIIANTKKCPKCLVRIEKNQGCNHMTCRSCKHEFCWVCMAAWEEHGNHTGGFYKCNKYDPKKKPTSGNEKEEAKAELDRYLHFFTRYHNHDQSRKLAKRVFAETERRMMSLQEKEGKNSSWIDVQFLRDAVEKVFECRQVLKYTYVFGYYLFSPSAMNDKEKEREKELFEFLQQELEKTTEQLSELSEMPAETIDRAQVANYTNITQSFLRKLLEGIERGLVVEH